MKGFWKNLKKWQKAGVLVGFLILIFIVVISVILTNKPPKVKIVFAEKNNIPSGEIAKIQTKLIKVVESNTGKLEDFTTYEGNARDYNEEQVAEEYTASFIVDFDDLEESYRVEVTWPDPDDGLPNIRISCALLAGKYPETPCKTESNSSSELINYLPYIGELGTGESYKIVGDYDNETFYIEVDVDSCGNEELMNKVLTAAQEWLLSINFDPDDYLIYVPGDICASDGMMDKYPYLQANHAKTNDQNVNKFLPYYIPEAYNVYPAVDENNNVVSIMAKVPGCYEYQMEPGKEFIMGYLGSKGIDYPVEFLECAE